MAAPAIILESGQVLIQKSASVYGLVPINGNPTLFGTVVLVNDLSDGVSVNDAVMYDGSKAKDFLYGSTIYALVNQEFISGVETVAP